MTPDDKRRRVIVMRLMCDRRLDFERLSRDLGLNFVEAYAKELESLAELVADGLVVMNERGVEVTPIGGPLLRIIAMRFDARFVSAPQRHAPAI